MIRRIDHIAIAVRDLERAKAFFIDCLGGRELFSCPVPSEKYRWTTIELGSSCLVELVDPLEADGFVHRFLERRGEGPHHITIQVDDIEAMHRMLEEKGVRTFGHGESLPGWKEFFIHPKEAFGVLIQFAEFNPLDWINPGYVPDAYREFVAGDREIEHGGSIHVQRARGAKGMEVEIRRGAGRLRIPTDQVPGLIQALEAVSPCSHSTRSPGTDEQSRRGDSMEKGQQGRDIEQLYLDRLPRSRQILERAKKVLLSPTATGPFRAPKAVAFVKEAKGSKIVDEDGNEYVDITMAYGPLILGHSHPVAVKAIQEACTRGTVYCIAHKAEVEMAELMVDSIRCAERVMFCNSGTEATMHAMRIARACTGKDKIAKFEGGYHGVHDYALISSILAQPAGPVEDPASVPDNPGIPRGSVEQVLTLSFNVPESLEKIRRYKNELAAVIVEPVPSSFPVDMGDFLQGLREVTRETGVLLIFDEVISGFRLAYGGAQEFFGITPDMATYGKIIGGGLPAGAVVGTVKTMRPLITTGDALQDLEEKLLAIGTFSGNPLTMTVGRAVLEYLRDHPEIYAHINGLAERIKKEVHGFCEKEGFDLRLIGLGSWFIPHFISGEATNPRDLRELADLMKQEVLCQYMRYHGVYLPDLHTVFVSAAHTEEDADKVADAFKKSLVEMRKDGWL